MYNSTKTSSIKNLKVLFFISKYLGLNPCNISSDGILEFSKSSFILSTAFVVSVSFILFWRVALYSNKYALNSAINTAFEFEIVAFAFTYVFSMGNSLIRCKELTKTVRIVSSVDYTIRPMFLKKTRSYFTHMCSLKLALGFLSATSIFIFLRIQYTIIQFMAIFPLYVIVYCGPYVILTQFSCLTHLCYYYFATLNQQIVNLNTITLYKKSPRQANTMKSDLNIKSADMFEANSLLRLNTRNTVDNCRFLAVIHGNLCDLVTVINSVYSFPILFNIANIFVTITVSLFCVFLIIFEYFKETEQCRVLSAYCVWCVLKLAIVFQACIACASEVSVFILLITNSMEQNRS
jgi:hypothetical protein